MVRYLVFTLKGLHSTAQGRVTRHPGNQKPTTASTLKGLYNPFGVEILLYSPYPGCVAQPWAVECNPFRVKTFYAT